MTRPKHVLLLLFPAGVNSIITEANPLEDGLGEVGIEDGKDPG